VLDAGTKQLYYEDWDQQGRHCNRENILCGEEWEQPGNRCAGLHSSSDGDDKQIICQPLRARSACGCHLLQPVPLARTNSGLPKYSSRHSQVYEPLGWSMQRLTRASQGANSSQGRGMLVVVLMVLVASQPAAASSSSTAQKVLIETCNTQGALFPFVRPGRFRRGAMHDL